MERIRKLLGSKAVRYVIAGGLTTLVNYAAFILLQKAFGVPYDRANAAAWVLAVAFAFAVNKAFVFRSRAWRGVWMREAAVFFAGRAFTGLVEIAGLPLLVRAGLDEVWFGVEALPAKVIVTVVVQVLNYVFSAAFAFRGENKKNKTDGIVDGTGNGRE